MEHPIPIMPGHQQSWEGNLTPSPPSTLLLTAGQGGQGRLAWFPSNHVVFLLVTGSSGPRGEKGEKGQKGNCCVCSL